MPPKLALITVHGMGRTAPTYADALFAQLRRRLGAAARDVHFGSVYYQNLLQKNEERVWNKVKHNVRWGDVREFLLYGFADAAGLEDGKEAVTSVYAQAQAAIAKELWRARQAVGNGPVVMLAHSLGCQVSSCYFWDAKGYATGTNTNNTSTTSNPDAAHRPTVGMWQDPEHYQRAIAGNATLTADDWAYLAGSQLRAFYTTGCNIPIFVAAHAERDILPFTRHGCEWRNFYDKDDVMGWPLAALSPQYAKVVDDVAVNAGGGVLSWLLKSWNPLSHEEYWGEGTVVGAVEQCLRQELVTGAAKP